MVGTKLERREGVVNIFQINNVVTMLHDMKDFLLLRFIMFCSVIFCFPSNFLRICLNFYETLSYHVVGMNAIGNIHEVRFPNISMLSHIVCYMPLLTIIIALAIKSVGF